MESDQVQEEEQVKKQRNSEWRKLFWTCFLNIAIIVLPLVLMIPTKFYGMNWKSKSRKANNNNDNDVIAIEQNKTKQNT